MDIEYKTDPLTKEKFIPTKITQKFASPANRIKFNNMKASKLNQERAFIDKPCRQSHVILKALYAIDPKKLYNIHYLEGKGVDFTAYNHQTITSSGKLPSYYDYALRNIQNTETYQIIKL